jgi:uncharacterized Ntn-hydrolase superfamily protein
MAGMRPWAHTYSIVARDPATGQLGVAVQSHYLATGSVVTWAEAGVGAVATQSAVEISYGPEGLGLLRGGTAAPEALQQLLALDESRERRQVAIIDAQGRVAAHTGAMCIAHAGHVAGEQFSVQANLMASASVWPAMEAAYRSALGDLTERMLVTLEAAEAEGGDIRGRQSAAILVVEGERADRGGHGKLFDLRVDDHPDPLVELRRLVRVQRAYHLLDAGEEALLEGGDLAPVRDQLLRAVELAPEMEELRAWAGMALLRLGEHEEGLRLFDEAAAVQPGWRRVIPALVEAGLVVDDPELVRRLGRA